MLKIWHDQCSNDFEHINNVHTVYQSNINVEFTTSKSHLP